MKSPALRRVWLPWLLLLVPTLLIGATALWLLRNEQHRLANARIEARTSAERAARDRAQVAADNIELLVAEIRDGLIRELSETPEADLEPLLANWPGTNPLVSATFLWQPTEHRLAWPPEDTTEHTDFRRRHAELFAAFDTELPAWSVPHAPTVVMQKKTVAPQELAVDEPALQQAAVNNTVFSSRQARQQVYEGNRASAEEAKARGNYADNRRAQNEGATSSPAPESKAPKFSFPTSSSSQAFAEAAKAKRLAEERAAFDAKEADKKAEAAQVADAQRARRSTSGSAAKPSAAPSAASPEIQLAEAAAPSAKLKDTSPVSQSTAASDADRAEGKLAKTDIATAVPMVAGAAQVAQTSPAIQPPAKSQAFAEPMENSAGPTTRWLTRTVNGHVFFLGWWQEKPGAVVRGVELNLSAVLERAQALLPPRDDTAQFALAGPDPYEDGVPSVEIPLSTTLPGWKLAAWFANPRTVTSDDGTAFFVIASLLVLAFAASILAGGALFFRQAAAAEREAALKTNFVSNVSHEMKTPLTTIRMYAEMLADERVSDPDKRRRYFATIGRETTRLTRLVNNALDFGRLEAGRKEYRTEDIALAPWLARLVDTHRPRLAELGLKLTLGNAAASAAVRGDADALEQMTLNLLDNAAKYAAAGGEIELRAEPANGAWSLVVADRGPGVPAAHRERIFERFHRVDDDLTAKTSGAGLGLTIARRLARDQGGDLVYRDRTGGGAEFVLTLPAGTETKLGGMAT